MQTGHTKLAIIGLLNSGVACFYYLRLIVRMYSRQGTAPAFTSERITADLDPANVGYVETHATEPRHNVPALLALAGALIATLWLGVAPGRVLSLAQTAAVATAPVGTATQHTAYDPAALH